MIFEITMASLCVTPYFWVFVGLLFLLFEVGTPGLFYFLSFSVAAFFTAVATLFIQTLLYQMIFFILMTIAAFMFLRLYIAGMIQETKGYMSNIDALVGKHAQVVVPIGEFATGQVKVEGEVWSARSFNGRPIEKDATVIICKVKGVHLIVKQI